MFARLRRTVLCLVCVGASLLASAATAGPARVRFVFDWPVPDFSIVPIVVGQKMGFYEKNGVSVDVAFPPDAQTTARMLATSQADIGFEPTTDVVFAVNQGLPLVAIANFTQRNSWCLIGRPGEPVDLSQLRGKSIGLFADSWSRAMMAFVLRKAHLGEHDVRLIVAQQDTLPLLLARRIDIATNGAAMGVAKLADTARAQPTLACNDSIGVPNIPVWVFTASPGWLAAHGATARAWLKGTSEAITWSLQHTDEAAALFTQAYPAAGSATYNTSGWAYTARLMTGPNGYFRQSDAQWHALTDALRSVGQIAQEKPASAYYTNAFLPD